LVYQYRISWQKTATTIEPISSHNSEHLVGNIFSTVNKAGWQAARAAQLPLTLILVLHALHKHISPAMTKE
jgi:hypothetical protein